MISVVVGSLKTSCGSLKLMHNNDTNLPKAKEANLWVDEDYPSEYTMLSSIF